MEMPDDIDPIIVILGLAVATVAASIIALRRPGKGQIAGWMPWNGLLFAAIVVTAICIAHLLGIQQH